MAIWCRGVSVEVVDLDDQVIATTKTAYDGFYILNKHPLEITGYVFLSSN